MTNQTLKSFQNSEKFQNAEQLWFWFLYTKSIRREFSNGRNCYNNNKKICELLDVETLITKMYLSGKLTDTQLSVMKEFGDKRRSPNQHIWSENKQASIWRNAMQTINKEAVIKGWIE